MRSGWVVASLACLTFGIAPRGYAQDANEWRYQDPVQRLREIGVQVNKAPREESSIGVRLGEDASMIWLEDMTEAEAKDADSAKRFEKVTEVVITRHAAWSVIDSVATMKNLEKLEFRECVFDHQASFLDSIAKRCPKLKELRFHQCRISRYVFRFLPAFENIKELEFDETYVGDGIIKFSKCFPKLELAEFDRSGAGDRDAAELAKLKDFRRVGFHECSVSGKGLKALAASKSVDWILGEFVETTDEEVSLLEKEFPKITFEIMLEPALK